MNKYGICEECNQPNTGYPDWCRSCNAKRFQQNFKNWTSGNDDIDKVIQDTQLSAHNNASNVLEWIPYSRFYDIKYIAKGGFGKVYKANWTDGCISMWNSVNDRLLRKSQNMFVVLKSLNDSTNIALNKVYLIDYLMKYLKF